MTLLNATVIADASAYDYDGAIIYIVGVLTWYAIGFGLIFIDDIDPPPDRRASNKDVCLYQTVTDLHEQQDRNDILVELKDKERRLKLWQIYYGSPKAHPATIKKDNEAVELIVKQLNELNERRRSLRQDLCQISFDRDDDGALNHIDGDEDDDGQNVPLPSPINRSISHEHFKAFFQ